MDTNLITITLKDINFKSRGVSNYYPPLKPSKPDEPEQPCNPIPHEYIQFEVSIPEITVSGLPEQSIELLAQLIKIKNQ